MGAPLKPRKRKQVEHPNMARYGEKCHFWRLWNDPATRPMMLERQRQIAKKAGRPEGVADGTTKKQIAELRLKAEAKAERIVAVIMDEDFKLEDLTSDEMAAALDLKASAEAENLVDSEKATARRMLKEAIVIGLTPGNRQTKLAAIRTVLEYTKAKPASTVNNNVNAAEEFLAALATKDK